MLKTSQNHKNPTNTPSPEKAITVTPPRAGTRAFFFHQPLGALGYTPDKRHIVKLSKHEGRSHQWVSTTTTPARLFRASSKLVSPYKNDLKSLSILLFTQLKDLKNRTDQDYAAKIRHSVIDNGHYNATKTNIRMCISSLKKCCKDSSNADQILEELNQEIQAQRLYNPFGLKRIYGDNESQYSLELAQDIHLDIITKSQCHLTKALKFDYSVANPSPHAPSAAGKGHFHGLFDGFPPLSLDETKKTLLPTIDGSLLVKSENGSADAPLMKI